MSIPVGLGCHPNSSALLPGSQKTWGNGQPLTNTTTKKHSNNIKSTSKEPFEDERLRKMLYNGTMARLVSLQSHQFRGFSRPPKTRHKIPCRSFVIELPQLDRAVNIRVACCLPLQPTQFGSLFGGSSREKQRSNGKMVRLKGLI